MIEKPFRLTQMDPDVTQDTVFGTTWRDTWDWRCPSKKTVVLKKGDRFSCKAYDSADVEYVAPDALVRIEVRDPSGDKVTRVYGSANYIKSRERQDNKKRAKLDLEQPCIVRPRDHIVVMTKDDTGMDTASIANSYFEVITGQIIGEFK